MTASYNRVSLTNELDLGETYMRLGEAKPITHTFRIVLWHNEIGGGYMTEVYYSFINTVVTRFYGSKEKAMNDAHDHCAELWARAIADHKANQDRIANAKASGEDEDGEQRISNRGVANAGKKWMRKDGKLERVPADQVNDRLANGWHFSGPRAA